MKWSKGIYASIEKMSPPLYHSRNSKDLSKLIGAWIIIIYILYEDLFSFNLISCRSQKKSKRDIKSRILQILKENRESFVSIDHSSVSLGKESR